MNTVGGPLMASEDFVEVLSQVPEFFCFVSARYPDQVDQSFNLLAARSNSAAIRKPGVGNSYDCLPHTTRPELLDT